jgi:membrane protein
MALRLPGPLKAPARLIWRAARGWSRDNVPRLGASLAYYSLFSLAPMLLIVIALAGTLFGADAVRGEIVAQLDGLIGTEGAEAVQALLEGAWRERSTLPAVIVGTVTFLLASTGAFLEMQHALNTIFRVESEPGSAVKEMVKDRLQAFGMVLVIGFLLMVSLAVSAVLAALSSWIGTRFVSISGAWHAIDWIVSLGIITVLFGMLYRYLPDGRLPWRDVWIGAAVTAILFTTGKELIGLYLGRSSITSSYGAAGSVMVLLLWVYYSAQLVLFGAEFTRVLGAERGRSPTPKSFARKKRK